ncbi:MAG TPA: serine hydrolase domain-containing protein [Thermoanaerobaculia bacterium]|nr:serine hydrolase domain-containing protein [Thermoanaerobaculia bacterium]
MLQARNRSSSCSASVFPPPSRRHADSRGALFVARRGVGALALAAGALLAGPAAGQPDFTPAGQPGAADAALAAQVEKLFSPWDRRDTPGCVVAVARAGRIVYQQGFGMASLTYGVRNTAETIFSVASISKQFTAMSVALLAEDGKLALDDDIRKFLPEMPAYERPITIRNLIGHTSGLRDYQLVRFLAGVPNERLSVRTVYELLARQRHTSFPPDTRFVYSNANYVLLRLIVERVSGQGLREFAAERIFKPLGMTHTTWSEDAAAVVPGRDTGYEGDLAVGFRVVREGTLMGSGGLLTTVGDLVLWDRNFDDNRLGRRRPELIRQAVTSGTLADGRATGYGFGLFLDDYRGHQIVWHAGGGPGQVADVVRFPAEKLSIFCLCNGTIDSRTLSRRVADLYLDAAAAPDRSAPRRAPAPAAAPERPAVPGRSAAASSAAKGVAAQDVPPAVELPPADLARRAGEYRNTATGTIVRAAVETGRLVFYVGGIRIELLATSPREFQSLRRDFGLRYVFEDGAGGAAQAEAAGMSLFEEGHDSPTARYERLPPPPAAAALAPYAGLYRNDELGAVYELRSEDGRLVLRSPVQLDGPLIYVGPDRMAMPSAFFALTVHFSRDAAGRVAGFELGADNADRWQFTRVTECGP